MLREIVSLCLVFFGICCTTLSVDSVIVNYLSWRCLFDPDIPSANKFFVNKRTSHWLQVTDVKADNHIKYCKKTRKTKEKKTFWFQILHISDVDKFSLPLFDCRRWEVKFNLTNELKNNIKLDNFSILLCIRDIEKTLFMKHQYALILPQK